MKICAQITRDRTATLCGLLRRQGAAARDVEITLPATAQACITVTPRRTAKSTRHNILTTLADPAFRMVRSDHARGMAVDYSPADTESGATLRITRAWMTEDGWPNGV